ncbi:MAG: PqqD family protein [Acidobacteriota bacterium]
MTEKSVPLRKHPDAASRVFDGEAFIVLPHRGQYKILNEVGTRVWDLLDGERTTRDIAQVIAEEYDVTIERALSDIEEMVSDLRSQGMLADEDTGKVA